MIIPLIGVIVLALVVFAFVLEPVLRARSDRVELDAVAWKPAIDPDPNDLDEPLAADQPGASAEDPAPDARGAGHVVERRAVGDAT